MNTFLEPRSLGGLPAGVPNGFGIDGVIGVGYVRWDARSDRVPPLQTIIFSSFTGRTPVSRLTGQVDLKQENQPGSAGSKSENLIRRQIPLLELRRASPRSRVNV